MAGCRSLNESEVDQVLGQLGSNRDKCLFALGVRTGFRVSELLSLKIGDVYQAGRVVDRVRVARRNMKLKLFSREVVLHPQAKAAIQALLDSTYAQAPGLPLFVSRQGLAAPLSRFRAHAILKAAYASADLIGALATHSMRKTFAKKVYTALKFDLLATQKALGHSCVTSTIAYLETSQAAIDAAVLS
jgi:integrase